MGRKELPDFEFNQNKEEKKKKQKVWYSMYSFVQKKNGLKKIWNLIKNTNTVVHIFHIPWLW